MTRPRVDYDQVAPLYDSQPYRAKEPDPELKRFLAEWKGPGQPALLDVGCGTGNQLVANLALAPSARHFGADPFAGMLAEGRRKTSVVRFVQARGEQLPFRAQSFDFITNQFSFHHVQAKDAMLADVFRMLKPGSRFVMQNLSPRDAPHSALYRYFPKTYQEDLRFFPSQEELREGFTRAGFASLELELTTRSFERPLEQVAAQMRRRDHCSQLIALDDASYEAGLRGLEEELATGLSRRVPDEVCLLKLAGTRPR